MDSVGDSGLRTAAAGVQARHRPSAASYDGAYFQQLYGCLPRQTAIDRLRDRLVLDLVRRYQRGDRLLEIGCGYGYLLRRFDRRWQLHATDASAHAAALAQRRVPHAQVVVADAQAEVPFSGAFDVILAVNVVEHLPEPEAAAHRLAAAVRPGGLLVVHLPTINNRFNQWLYRYTYERDPTHVYRPSGREVDQLFEQAGFRTRAALHCPFRPARLWRALMPHPAYLAAYVKR